MLQVFGCLDDPKEIDGYYFLSRKMLQVFGCLDDLKANVMPRCLKYDIDMNFYSFIMP